MADNDKAQRERQWRYRAWLVVFLIALFVVLIVSSNPGPFLDGLLGR